MKLIFLPKGGEGINKDGVFPIMEVPTSAEGAEKTSLNDFQWWAPTDKWQEWLKKHPRDWKAESEEVEYDQEEIYNLVLEYFDPRNYVEPGVVGFEDFDRIWEDEEGEKKEEVKTGVSDEEAKKRFTKLTFAFNSLSKEGKITESINLNQLTPNQDLALFLDLAGENGESVPETRNAYKFKLLQTSQKAKFLLGQISETILTGPIPDDEPIGTTFRKVAGIIGRVALIGGISILGISLGYKLAAFASTRLGITRAMRRLIPRALRTVAGSIGRSTLGPLSRVFKGGKYFVSSLGGLRPFLFGIKNANFNQGFIKVLSKGRGIAAAFKNGLSAAKTARQTAGVAKATNPIGWIMLGLEGGQRLYNWFSTNQAPRFGEIEDDGVGAQNSFSPGTIPDGQSITVCWTQEAGQSGFLSFLASMLIANDTRTTMEIVKLGNFNGKAVFYLVDVHSESYEKLLAENSMILLFFDQGAKFEHGFFDNDDLDLEVLSIKDSSGLTATTYFQGYCPWNDLKSTYDKADDKILDVPKNAPDKYSFYFKYGKANREINVKGKLVTDLSSIDTVKNTFGTEETGGGKKGSSSSNESYLYDTSSGVLSFSQFSSGDFDFYSDYMNEEDEKTEEISPEKIKENLPPETQEIASYTVESIEYADKNLGDQELPDLFSFIIPSEYLEAEDEQSISVDPIQEITIKSPKRGTIVIETEEVPQPVPVQDTGATGATGSGEPEVEGGVPVEVTKDEVKIKYRDNPDALNDIGIPDVTKIKDKDKEDKIKFLDMITPEEKEDLGIKDWNFIKKVKVYKDGKTGDPIMIKFKAGGMEKNRSKKIKSSDEKFDVALKVANRIQAGFKEDSDKTEEED